MKIIYSKDEIHDVMQAHYKSTHYGPDDRRKIEQMALAPDQVTIVLGEIPEVSKEDES